MRYPNATRGVRLLLISHGLQLALALFQTLLALVFPVISYQYALSPVFGWINRALTLGALVLMLLGILLARRDEEAFRPALVPVCVLLGGVFVFNILPSFWSSAFSSGVLMWGFYAYLFLSTLLYLWVWLSMTDGVIALARDCRERGLARYGKLLLWLIPISCIPALAQEGLVILNLTGAKFYQNNWEVLSQLGIVLNYIAMGLGQGRLVLLLILLIWTLVMLKRVRAAEANPEGAIISHYNGT